jgi:hypothetical protein
MKAQTINEHVEGQRKLFRHLSESRQNTLRREARAFIYRNPGAADHSNFWRGLSARQVLSA